jgi:hypothetical protein
MIKMDIFRLLLFLVVSFIVHFQIAVASEVSLEVSLKNFSAIALPSEYVCIEQFEEIFYDAREFPIFWKRKLIALECSGNLIGLRMGTGLRGITYQKVVGITPEQKEQMLSASENNLKKFLARRNKISHYPENATFHDTVNIIDEVIHLVLELINADSIDIRKLLTKEQLQRVRELELVLPPIIDNELEFSINFDAYEALELSNEQRDKLSVIKKQHAKLQDEVALMGTGLLLPILPQYSKENSSQENENNYAMQRLLQKNNLIKKVNTFKAEVRDSILNILTPPQQNKLAQLNLEIRRQLAIKKSELIKPKTSEEKN